MSNAKKTTILTQIVDTIASAIDNLYTEKKLTALGYLADMTDGITNLRSTTLYNFYNGYPLPKKYLDKIISAPDYSLERLCNVVANHIDLYELQSGIYNLFKTYFPNIKADFSLMVSSLMYLYLTGINEKELSFPYSALSTCKNYVSWTDKEDDFLRLLHNKQIILLAGNPGSGKKEFCRSVLKKYCTPVPDVLFIRYEETLSDDFLQQISFSDGLHSADITYQRLSEKPVTSALVIIKPTITTTDITYLKERLGNLNLRIIVITYTHHICDEYVPFNIDERPSNELLKIYKNKDRNTSFTKEEFEELCEIVNYNPVAITLIAGTLKKEPSLKQRFLNKEKWIWYEKGLPEISTSYNTPTSRPSVRMTTLLKRLLSVYPSHLYMEGLSELTIWCKTPMSKEALYETVPLITSRSNESVSILIEDAISYGILQYNNESNKLFMPSLIADTIWYTAPIKYNDYLEQLVQFFNYINIGNLQKLAFETMLSLIINMIHRFYFQVALIKDRPTPEELSTFENFNMHIIKIMHYLIKIGKTLTARELLNYLFVTTDDDINPRFISISKRNDAIYIKKMLTLQLDYISHDTISSSLIPDLIELSENYVKKSRNSSRTKYLDALNYGYQYCQLIMYDLMDVLINSEMNLSLERYITKSLLLPSEIQHTLCVLDTYLSKITTQDSLVIYRYYQMLHSYINAIYSDYPRIYSAVNTMNLSKSHEQEHTKMFQQIAGMKDLQIHMNQVGECMKQLLLSYKDDLQLFLQAKIQNLYHFALLLFMLSDIHVDSFLSYDSRILFNRYIENCEKEYCDLYAEIDDKIISVNILCSFYYCTLFFVAHKAFLSPSTVQKLQNSITKLHVLLNEQLSLPENKQYRLEDAIKKIENITFHSETIDPK